MPNYNTSRVHRRPQGVVHTNACERNVIQMDFGLYLLLQMLSDVLKYWLWLREMSRLSLALASRDTREISHLQ